MNGTVLAWLPDVQASAKGGNSIKDSDLFREMSQDVGQQAANAAAGAEHGAVREGTMLWAMADTTATREAGLHVLVGVPREQLLAPANDGLFQDIATLVGVLVLLFCGILGLRRIQHPAADRADRGHDGKSSAAAISPRAFRHPIRRAISAT